MNSTRIELTDSFEIILNGTCIGFIEAMGEYNHIIAHIEIFPEYRGDTYSKDATIEFIKLAQDTNAPAVQTSTVVSGAYQQILQELDFCSLNQNTDRPFENKYIYRL